MPSKSKTHYLLSVTKGSSRWKRGEYACSCGHTATGRNAYETHRAEAHRIERGEANNNE